ncbi:putative E3 ubiquitin-protein ligase LIN-1 isoform X1 [Prosopis cineraria]|uniref:putative E3 ubiquitin-protein ligase LIN-1 isoform X1 n=1 Tax=Prosopis cineraria TaxID=364024 RepID=UPI00240FB513|nr:putative E3 ubiquitin-protein ligase LIN-1 isoform X1 [Prosopis cineraria]
MSISTTTNTTTTTSSQILQHTSAFISDVLLHSQLRRRLISTLLRESQISSQITLKHLNLAANTLDNAISVSNPAIRSSSLNLAEKLLLPLPQNPVSSFLLSLIYMINKRQLEAALSLLQTFYLSPSLARSEIAPILYEQLFSLHLLPVFRSFDEQRARILPSTSENSARYPDDYSISDEYVVLPSTKSLSQMSNDQASKLRELERDYEEAIDDNCRIIAEYFKEVLVNNNGDSSTSPPLSVLKSDREDAEVEHSQGETAETSVPLFKNGRYNQPIWTETALSSSSFSAKWLNAPFYPQRVSPKILKHQESSKNLSLPSHSDIDAGTEPSVDENMPCYSSESEAETEEKDNMMVSLKPRRSQIQESEPGRSPDYAMADYDHQPHRNEKCMPPKDFVCPITSNLFDDPVTLETGQTYERKAIEEWFNRGNSTCPITRQKLQNTQLPKTNYVLKRLIASWKEQNPNSIPSPSPSDSLHAETEVEIKSTMPSTSPNSVITQANVDGMIRELRHAINKLYMSEVLEESEMAVLQIEQLWKEVNLGVDIQSMLSKPPIINGFMEILFNSVDPQVLQVTVFLLAEMGTRDNAVIQTLTQVDSDVECIMALFKKGLTEAVVLIYLLKPPTTTLAEMAMLESLITVFDKKEEDLLKMCIKPKSAVVLLLARILGSNEERIASSVAKTLITNRVIGYIIGSFRAEWAEERIAAAEILLRCIQEDGTCRHVIAERVELSPILESFVGANDAERFKIIQFFSELVKLNRRTFNEQILHIIKEEGSFSTMHTFLVYMQTALQDQCPVVAGLLLQLDLLVEPRKMSIYREESIDTLISCLRNTDFPAAQVIAAETIVSLQGRFNFSGKPLTREVLLKRAGVNGNYRNLDQMDHISGELEMNPEEEKAADDWERKIASVLVSHEFGLLFEAFAEGVKSRSTQLSSACFVSATWLTYMLNILPDTGTRGAACVCMLKHFVSILKSSKDTEDRVLSMLALNSFLQYPDALLDLSSYTKDVLKGLRELKRFSPLASEMLKFLVEENESKAGIWMHKELIQVDCSENGEVLSVICHKDKIFSGHSDGTIKVWTVRGSLFHLIQETQEHTKAVSSLSILESIDRLYSGSLDRSVKVWSIGKSAIQCVQVHDMKDHIHNLAVTNNKFCYIPQGNGVKVQSLHGELRLLNSNKYIRCLALAQERLYCGCHDNSIQEIDLEKGTVNTIQSGSKRLLGKANPVYALQIHGEHIYAASSTLDGVAIKIWKKSNYSMIGSLVTASEVRTMALSSELIYLGCKGGAVEIWDRKKHNRIDTLQIGTNGKITCMAIDDNEEILVIGTSDGRIQAWGIN